VGVPLETQYRVPNLANKKTPFDDPNQWWCLGYYLGGGWMRQNELHFLVRHENEVQVSEKLTGTLGARRVADHRGCATYAQVTDPFWVRLVKNDLDCGRNVPLWAHAAPHHLLSVLVDGMLAADGCARPEGGGVQWRFSTPHANIALALHRIMAKLGIVASVRKLPAAAAAAAASQASPAYMTVLMGRKIYQKEQYVVVFKEGGRDIIMDSTSFDTRFMWLPIIDIRERHHRKEPVLVYNFEVSEDNSYVAENIAVHNCIGFSACGAKEGFSNAQSGLYTHVVRLFETLRPPLLFLENVPGLCSSSGGLDCVLDSFQKNNYDASWLVLPAFAVGSPTHRYRWFCLGVRKDVREMKIKLTQQFQPHPWHEGEANVPRMLPNLDKLEISRTIKRLSMLGNGVVPDAVRRAFCILFTGFTVPADEAVTALELSLIRPEKLGKKQGGRRSSRYIGTLQNGVEHTCTLPPGAIPPKPMTDIVLDPAVVEPTKPPNTSRENIMTETYTKELWATPRAGNLGANLYLTVRGRQDLLTQLRFEKKTPPEIRLGHGNPEWVEFVLMGLPKGWTANDDENPAPARPGRVRKPRKKSCPGKTSEPHGVQAGVEGVPCE
jgi:hypothetical protein